MQLHQWGWNALLQQKFEELNRGEECLPARVVYAQRESYRVICAAGELTAHVSGRFRHIASVPADFPTAGDWVGIRRDGEEGAGSDSAGGPAVIRFLLPRITWLSRQAAGQEVREQLICANLDWVFLVSGLDRDFNLRRIERYLSAVYEGGAQPLVVLNKVDLCPDPEAKIREVQGVAFSVPVICTDALGGTGMEQLDPYLQEGKTAAFAGSSGVGKSTLLNQLLGREAQAVRGVRGDGKGRHTTTHRELFLIPGRGMLIDNPGMRELQLWAHEQSLGDTFADVERLASRCRFGDCSHGHEPGCAVRKAAAAGELPAGRLDSYLKQKRELERLDQAADMSSRERSNLRRREARVWEKQIRERFKDSY